jgi:hypothetical protein
VRQDLTGHTLEVIERLWKSDRFGGHRVVSEYLQDWVLFYSIRTKVKRVEQNQ